MMDYQSKINQYYLIPDWTFEKQDQSYHIRIALFNGDLKLQKGSGDTYDVIKTVKLQQTFAVVDTDRLADFTTKVATLVKMAVFDALGIESFE